MEHTASCGVYAPCRRKPALKLTIFTKTEKKTKTLSFVFHERIAMSSRSGRNGEENVDNLPSSFHGAMRLLQPGPEEGLMVRF